MKAFASNAFFWWTLVCYFLLLWVFNEKSYVLVTLLYGSGLFFFFDFGITKTLFTTLLLTLPFQRGIRGWSIQVMPPGAEPWMTGYSFYFGFSLKLIFAVALILLLGFKKIDQQRSRRRQGAAWLMIGFFFLSLISTVGAERFPLSALGLISLTVSLTAYFTGRVFFLDRAFHKRLPQIFLAAFIIMSFVGARQFILQHSLGLFLEDSAFRTPSGFFTLDGAPMYRASGLTGHPTFFGSYLSLLLPVAMGLLLFSISKTRNARAFVFTCATALCLGIIALLGTLSRSGWIAFFLTTILFLWRLSRTIHKKRFIKASAVLVFPVVLLLLVYAYIISTRLRTLSDIWTAGTGRGRLDLVEQAWFMMRHFPVFGVGLNHFTYIMAQQDLVPRVRAFLYPVHNTFLLFSSELGIPAGILFALFVAVSLWRSWKRVQKSWVLFGVWVGALTFIINAQFHTLFHQDPTFDTFMVMLSFLSVL